MQRARRPSPVPASFSNASPNRTRLFNAAERAHDLRVNDTYLHKSASLPAYGAFRPELKPTAPPPIFSLQPCTLVPARTIYPYGVSRSSRPRATPQLGLRDPRQLRRARGTYFSRQLLSNYSYSCASLELRPPLPNAKLSARNQLRVILVCCPSNIDRPTALPHLHLQLLIFRSCGNLLHDPRRPSMAVLREELGDGVLFLTGTGVRFLSEALFQLPCTPKQIRRLTEWDCTILVSTVWQQPRK